MKARYFILPTLLTAMLSLSACVDSHDAPEFKEGQAVITSPVSIGETNYSIYQLKKDNESLFNQAQIDESSKAIDKDLILEGVVVGNDADGANLYQQIILRDIDEENGTDQLITLGIRSSGLFPYFMLGQRIKVNLRGLHIGCYSYVPKIGEPYITSLKNLRLGAMMMERVKTNIELVGVPDPHAPELQPVVLDAQWLDAAIAESSSAKKIRNGMNFPMFVTVTGKIKEVQGDAASTAERGEYEKGTNAIEPLPKVYGPKALRDAGWGVNRHIIINGSSNTVTLRTGTSSPISNTVIPQDSRSYTGILSYYGSELQLQLRSLKDIDPRADE